MKHLQIFRDHPTLMDGEEETILPHLANAMVTAEWLKTGPCVRTLKVAAIVEATTNRRAHILDRILGRLFKLEKSEAMKQLIALNE